MKLPLQEVYDMSWAEFVLRSIGFKEEREREEELYRAVAYQSYCAQFAMSKKKPKKIDDFWQIGKRKSITKTVPEAFKRLRAEYEKKMNG